MHNQLNTSCYARVLISGMFCIAWEVAEKAAGLFIFLDGSRCVGDGNVLPFLHIFYCAPAGFSHSAGDNKKKKEIVLWNYFL